MKKDIASQLNAVADGMPLLFKWTMMPEKFTGEELNLTPLGERYAFEPGVIYVVDMPALVAAENKQQIKDAYKRGGLEEVQRYHRKHMAEVKECNSSKVQYFDKDKGLTDSKTI